MHCVTKCVTVDLKSSAVCVCVCVISEDV